MRQVSHNTSFTVLRVPPNARSVRHIPVQLASGAHFRERRIPLKFEVPEKYR